MCLCIDCQEGILCHLLPSLSKENILLLRPTFLENRENDNIQALINVCCMGRIAEDFNVGTDSILQELKSVMRVMSINKQ